jgi:hypothetical protein
MARGDFVGCIVVYMQVGEFKRCYEDILQDSGVNLGASHPVVYSPAYNIKLLGLEKLHPFDMGKFAKIIAQLEQTVGLQKVRLQPRKSRLAIVHAFAKSFGTSAAHELSPAPAKFASLNTSAYAAHAGSRANGGDNRHFEGCSH